MEKTFDPKQFEAAAYKRWEDQGYFSPTGTGKPFCIQLPPPNVTGTLHMGHAFQQTLMDLMSRYQRMRGADVLWQCGTDHAGIATQKIVENQLAAENTDRRALGREAFLKRVWRWKEESGSTITRQMRRLGASCDWSRERFTLDEGLSAAVRKVFIDWYRAGLIYRGNRLVHWDPSLGTAVSDLEVENREKEGFLWSIKYLTESGDDQIVVATTRPETMLGDVAVAVHPEDSRYAHLIGRNLKLPLTDRLIPVVADNYVDPMFGTGAVKITPAHDFNDFALGQRHGLVPLNVLTLDAKLNEAVPLRYQGMDRFAARKLILEDLEGSGHLVETKPHKLMLPISQRSDAVTEPMLTDQWFVDLTQKGKTEITQPALNAVRSGAIRFVPESWSTTYINWLENIQDWCISRQLWWGHRIPAWYDESGNIFIGHNEADARLHAAIEPVGTLRQDEDVLDTWFSSALWPFSTLGWPGTDDLSAAEWTQFQRFLPSSVLVTGFDIIFFWVARMVMATGYFVGRQADGNYAAPFSSLNERIPFKTVYINAIVQDAEGKKMSKSKGNTIDPLDLVDGIGLEALLEKSTATLMNPLDREKVAKRIVKDYPNGISAVGADALRFTFCALATHGRTIAFDFKRCEGYKNFCNKLWNAARFVALHTEGETFSVSGPWRPTSYAERWICNELRQTTATVHEQIALYRFDLAAQALYDFTWNEYCDWFVELAKPTLASDDESAKRQVKHGLLTVLDNLLRLLHPIIPFITDEISQSLAPRLGESVAIATRRMPEANDFPADQDAAAEISWLKGVLNGVRRIRGEMNIPSGKLLPLIYSAGGDLDRLRQSRNAGAITSLAKLESQHWLNTATQEPNSAVALVGELKLLIPLAGIIDVGAERARLERELTKLNQEISKCESKLASATFVSGAPAAVVEQERQRLHTFGVKLSEIQNARDKLVGL